MYLRNSTRPEAAAERSIIMARTTGPRSIAPASAANELEKQRAYARRLADMGFDYSLVVAEAFVRGIRDIGYKHTGTALDELIDNAIQAAGRCICVAFGFGGGSDAKPDRIAI